MSRNHNATWRPRVDVLEDRSCPSCTVKLAGSTLTITGDAFNNDVRLTAHGSHMSVNCDQGLTVTADGIRQIAVDLDGGADRFTMVRTVPTGPNVAAVSPLLLRVSTGAGDDVVNLGGKPGSQDTIWVDLGKGDDRFDAQFIPPPDPDVIIPPPDPDVPATASVFLSVQGGLGNDRITSRMGIQPTPFTPNTVFEVVADGGAGDDVLIAEVDLHPVATPFASLPPVLPTARFAVALNGGLGDDDCSARMGVEPTPFLPQVDFDVAIDGGAGDDFMAVDSHVDPTMLVGFNPQPEPPSLNFVVDLHGGLGSDQITSRLGVEPTPFAPPVIGYALTADGGAGNDVIDVQFDSGATQQKVAGLHVALFGGAGNDALRLTWTPGIAFDVDAVADGGAGFDFGVFSPGVRFVNVERLG